MAHSGVGRGQTLLGSWQLWALLSAAFAALTALFAMAGIEHVNSDCATFIRTVVVVCAFGAILVGTGRWQPLGSLTGRTDVVLALSGLATGGSWLCGFRTLTSGAASRIAPVDKLSVVLVALFGVAFLGA